MNGYLKNVREMVRNLSPPGWLNININSNLIKTSVEGIAGELLDNVNIKEWKNNYFGEYFDNKKMKQVD